MYKKTLAQISKALQTKEISSVELVKLYLERINTLDKKIDSFITVTPEIALQQAQLADKKIAAGNANSLCGIPVAHKDVFCTKDVLTTSGSKMLGNFIAPYDATVVANLSNSNMVMLGKTNMDEFAMGSSTENSAYKITKNPWDFTKIPGGSSGGSAAAVAAALAPVATGTDTGGSIRQPAGLTGTSGIKPTYGRVSRWGQIAFASSFDQAGLFAKSAEDLAMTLNSLAGFDEKDSTCVTRQTEEYTQHLQKSIKGLKIGIPSEYFISGLDNGVAEIVQQAITKLEKMGATIIDISLPDNEVSLAAYYVLAPAEASSNLARFDGVRYGYRTKVATNYKDLYLNSRSEGFGDEVKRRIMTGTYSLSSGYYEAYYLKAQQTRRYIRDKFLQTLNKCDVIIGPVSQTVAWDIGEKKNDAVSMYLSDLYTIPVNLAGLPAMSIPVGFSNNLPVGMHIIGNYFSEAKLLNIAHQYQLQTDYHLQIPQEFK